MVEKDKAYKSYCHFNKNTFLSEELKALKDHRHCEKSVKMEFFLVRVKTEYGDFRSTQSSWITIPL